MPFSRRDATPIGKRCNGLAEVMRRFGGRDVTGCDFLCPEKDKLINELVRKRERCNALPCPDCKWLFCSVFLVFFVRNECWQRERCNGGLVREDFFRAAVNHLRCAFHASRKPRGDRPWLPVERMRSTPGGCGRNFPVSHAPKNILSSQSLKATFRSLSTVPMRKVTLGFFPLSRVDKVRSCSES
jgi:hypothetical protein